MVRWGMAIKYNTFTKTEKGVKDMRERSKYLLLLGIVFTLLFVPGIKARAEVFNIECGVGVTGSLNTGTGVLTISGNGEIGDSTNGWSWFSGKYYDENGWSHRYSEYVYKVVIGDGITGIGNYAFYDLDKLQSVTFGKNVARIGRGAFCGCEGLYSIEIPGSVTEIGVSAFNGSSLKTCTLHEGLKTIGDSAFYDTDLSTIKIPEYVESIGSNAFPTVKTATIPHNITLIKSRAFGQVDVTIYSMTVTIGEDAFDYGSTIKAEHGSTADTYAANHSDDVTIRYFPRKSTVYFNANGGSVSTASKTVVSDYLYNTLPTPVRRGYAFKGWYTKVSGGRKVLATDKVTTTKDSTLYAHWSAVSVNAAGKPKATNKKGRKAFVKIPKVKGAKGYQVRYATNAKMKGAKTKITTKRSVTLKKLKRKTYYVQVRAYKVDSARQKIFGKWSKKCKVRIRR